jgi:hypothetical protein
MVERSDGDRREFPPTLGLGEAAPNTVGLPDLESIGPTVECDGTDLAYSLCPNLPSLPFVLTFLGARRKEEMGMVAAAQCDRLPGTVK